MEPIPGVMGSSRPWIPFRNTQSPTLLPRKVNGSEEPSASSSMASIPVEPTGFSTSSKIKKSLS
mgnify:CR=1 FL=1